MIEEKIPKLSIIIRNFKIEDVVAVINLWEKCNLIVPWNDPYKDISRKMKIFPELFLVGILKKSLISSVMGGYDGHRGWINYLAVDPDYQNQGFGKKMMESVELKLKNMGCPKINLQVRNGNESLIKFYEKIGYLNDKATSLGKRLEKDY